jgi:hypothetical protein
MDHQVTINRCEIWYSEYNFEKRENLKDIPAESAVFGIFAMVDNEPANCRYVGTGTDLRATVRSLFENADAEGLRKFMQGPWKKILQYQLISPSFSDEPELIMKEWRVRFKPNINDEGEYPGYYDAHVLDE